MTQLSFFTLILLPAAKNVALHQPHFFIIMETERTALIHKKVIAMFEPIGIVRSSVTDKIDHDWGVVISQIVIDEPFADGLQGLEDFSHIIVVYHLNQAKFLREKHLVRHPQGRGDLPCVGIFSQRAKDRPNPIGITAAKLLSVHENIVEVQGLDAIDGTPVLDIKPYFPQYDLKNDARVPDWVNVLMKDYF